ncbi:MAG: ABC transporter ATP-binding protein [Bacteroidales bacterium]|nr:ABC transporter ATP-binding protein [Bacteroidales bacterium]
MKSHKTKSPIGRVFAYLRYFRWEIVGNVLFNVLAVLFNLSSFVMIIPFAELLFGMTEPPATAPTLAFNQEALMQWMLWHMAGWKSSMGVWRPLLFVGGAYLLCNLLSNTFRYLGLFFLSTIRNGVVQHLRDDVYRHLTVLPLSFFSDAKRGDVVSRLSNDIADVEWSVVSTLQSLVKDPVNIVFFATTLVFVSPKLFLFFLVIMPIVVLLIGRIGRSLKRNSQRGQAELGTLFATLEETLQGIRTLHAFNQAAPATNHFRQENDRYAHTMVQVARKRELGSPLSEVLGTIGLMAILTIGGMIVIRGEIAASVFVFFIIIFARLIPPVQAVVKAYNSLQKGSASAARIFELIDAPEGITQKADAVVLEDFTNCIEYRDVSFSYTPSESEGSSYPESGYETVLQHINLTIHKGSMVAIVGASGAGKTTMIDLLSRFYDCTEGQILFDGRDIRDVHIGSLRSLISMVTQHDVVFADTMASNIALGRTDACMEDIRRAAQLAHADEFISTLPNGYDTVAGDGGQNLSGGQRQRISIARALLKDAPILILDEATSALDNESEHAVQQALSNLTKDRTTIVIAHRLSTIRNADHIVVMDRGQIVEQGTHLSLMQQKKHYYNLVKTQISPD